MHDHLVNYTQARDQAEDAALADSDDGEPLGPKPPSPRIWPFVDGVTGLPTPNRRGC